MQKKLKKYTNDYFSKSKKIDFTTLFKKQFDKLLLFYKEDEKIVGKVQDFY